MNSLKPWISEATIGHRLLALTLAFCLGGIPQAFAQAAQTTTQSPQAAQPAPRPNSNSTLVPDPSKGPLQPAQSQPQDLPNAPSSNNPAPQTTMTAPQDQTQQPAQKVEPPLGAAAAETGRPAGGLASKPAGNAIAPAKQRQVRSMLIKVGAIAAGAAALGIVYGLSRSTSSTPPGATSTAGH